MHKISVQIIPMPNYTVQYAAEGIKANVISLRVLLLLSSILYRRRRPSIFLRLTRYANWIHIAYPRERERNEKGGIVRLIWICVRAFGVWQCRRRCCCGGGFCISREGLFPPPSPSKGSSHIWNYARPPACSVGPSVPRRN